MGVSELAFQEREPNGDRCLSEAADCESDARNPYHLAHLSTQTQHPTKVSYHNNYAYLQKVDQLPKGPGWKCEIVTAAGNQLDENDEMMTEDLELWKRDPVECIKELMGNPAFRDYMVYAPERVYSSDTGSEESRILDEMWTANWWWEMQVCLKVICERCPLTLNCREDYRHCRRCYYLNNSIRQDAAYAAPRRQDGLAGLSHHWKHR
jgi:hypothetical protein